MGKANRQRRTAKAKKRDRTRSRRRVGAHAEAGDTGSDAYGHGDPHQSHYSQYSQAEMARSIIALVALGHPVQTHPAGPTAVDRLRSLSERIVDRVVEDFVLEQVGHIWEGGWQPAELHREVRRSTKSAAAAHLVAAAIAADHLDRPANSLDPRWRDQIESMDLPALDDRRGWFTRWVTDETLSRVDALDKMLDVIMCITTLPALKPLMALPGIAGGPPRPVMSAGVGGSAPVSDPVLERVRGLLAKAESTTFEAEAEAFTAKAQELMTKHAIDAALLQAATGDEQHPVMIRVPVDAPYADGKALLLHAVASASRCRAVSHSNIELVTIAGFPDDVAATEMLFTSLLVQAQAALAEAARGSLPGSRERRQGYRSAFYLSYANRIGDRLCEINDHLVARADDAAQRTGGLSALPVLRAREARIDDLIAEQFGELTSMGVRQGSDPAGWGRGRIAADQARFDFGDLETTADDQPAHAGPMSLP